MSCPSASLCVDGVGNVLTATSPAGGAGAWNATPVASSIIRITAVSCPAASLCVAVDGAGNVLASTNPTGGADAWTVSNVDGSNTLSAVSCASTSLCVAVDGVGNVVTSTNPTGGAGAWTVSNVDGSNTLSAVSCASTSFCVAVDGVGNVVTSIDPTGGSGAWGEAKIDGDPYAYLSGISCPSATFCVAVGSGNVFTSSDPTGGPGAWTATRVGLSQVTCVSASLCVGVGGGSVVTSTNPTGGAGAWTVAEVDAVHYPADFLSAVSCPSASLCVAFDSAGNVVTSTDPTGGAGAWAITNVDGANPLTGVSCPAASLCVAIDRGGNVVTSTDPTGGASAWHVVPVDTKGVFCAGFFGEVCFGLTGISCPSASLCVAVDLKGDVVASTDPTGGASAWHVAHVDTEGVACSEVYGCYGISAVSCASPSLCVAVDEAGNAVTSTNPTGGSSAWHVAHVDPGDLCTPSSGCHGLSGVSCPSRSLCVAADVEGSVLTSTNPTGGARAWTTATVQGNIPGIFDTVGVSCPSPSFCLAVNGGGSAGGTGTVITSTNPTGGVRDWRITKADGDRSLLSVSCARATSLCVAGDNGANALTSVNPNGGARAWTITRIDSQAISQTANFTDLGLSGVSCPTPSLCIAVDTLGNVVVGQGPAPPPPANTSVPKISGRVVQGQRLTEAHGSWKNSPTLFAYQWEDCNRSGNACKSIAGATRQTLVLRAADVGHTIRVREFATSGGGTGGPATSSATHVAKVAAGQIKAQLLKNLTPSGKPSRIPVLLKKGGYVLRFKALMAGRVLIAWYYLPKGAHIASGKPKPVVVATTKKSFTEAATVKLTMKLTRTGRRLLKHARGLGVTAKGTFTPSHGAAILAIKAFTLKR